MPPTGSAAATGDLQAPTGPVAAMQRSFLEMVPSLDRGWILEGEDFIYGVMGAPLPFLNGVFAVGPAADEHAVAEGLERVAASGVPHCVQTRPGAEHVASMAVAHGLVLAREIPFMVRQDVDVVVPETPGLTWERVGPSGADRYVDLMARGFEMPKEVARIFGAEGFLSHPAINVLVGLLGDDWVTTGLSMTTGTFVGIYNVAVVPEHRRKGFGSATTLRALAAGAAAGGTSAYLQASDDGYGVYEHLGFVESERWKLFVSGS